MSSKIKYLEADDLIWETPEPPKKPANLRWDEVRQMLYSHPNEWAIVAVQEVVGKSINGVQIKKVLGHGFETATRRRAHDTVVYARYVMEE